LGQGTLGRVHYFIDNENNIVVDQHLFILRANKNLLYPTYLYNVLSSKPYQLQIERQITGSTGMLMLNASNLKDMPIICPNIEVSLLFEKSVSGCYDKISINDKQNQEHAALRDWLLPMLMNGQVRVEDIEKVEEINMAAVSSTRFNSPRSKNSSNVKFEQWLQYQGLAAR